MDSTSLPFSVAWSFKQHTTFVGLRSVPQAASLDTFKSRVQKKTASSSIIYLDRTRMAHLCAFQFGKMMLTCGNALYQCQCVLTLNYDANREGLLLRHQGWSFLQTYLHCCHTNPWVHLGLNRKRHLQEHGENTGDLVAKTANTTTSSFTQLISSPLILTFVLPSITRITYPGETVEQQQSLAGSVKKRKH